MNADFMRFPGAENNEEVAKDFLMLGIQEWGQPESERARATARYVWQAGFRDIEPSGFPIFGGMFPQRPITGREGAAATAWLGRTLDDLRRGKFETEVEQLVAALVASQRDAMS